MVSLNVIPLLILSYTTTLSRLFLHLCFFFKECFRSSFREMFSKKVFLEIPQNSQENTCATVPFLIKLQLQPLVVASDDFGSIK